MKVISLRAANSENWRQLAKLKVCDEQREFVAENSFYLAQAAYEVCWKPFGIYRGKTPVGLCMYGQDPGDGEYWIAQLMIDARWQSLGIGRIAMGLLVDRLRKEKGCIRAYLSFEPWNSRAKALYESMGFVDDCRMAEEDVVYRLDIS